jgi:hypothetical protein
MIRPHAATEVEQVGLDLCDWGQVQQHHTTFLVMKPGPVEPLQQLGPVLGADHRVRQVRPDLRQEVELQQHALVGARQSVKEVPAQHIEQRTARFAVVLTPASGALADAVRRIDAEELVMHRALN